MKFILVLTVVVVGLWFFLRGRDAARRVDRRDDASAAGKGAAGPVAMVACARCGLHLPQADALRDAQGRSYCGAEHRDAGPG